MRADAEALYNANQRGLFRYFVRAVGHAETARDLTQDVFVRVSRSVIPAAPEAALRGWLFQIARNLALDHHRSGQRRPPAEPLIDTARPASQDTSAEVNEALALLADVDRDVFLMREVAGLAYDEIATACGLTPDAVRSRIHRARLQLRDRLSSQIAVRQGFPMRRSGKTDPNATPSGTLPLTNGASEASTGSRGGGAPRASRGWGPGEQKEKR